jgi:hypothetical protein
VGVSLCEAEVGRDGGLDGWARASTPLEHQRACLYLPRGRPRNQWRLAPRRHTRTPLPRCSSRPCIRLPAVFPFPLICRTSNQLTARHGLAFAFTLPSFLNLCVCRPLSGLSRPRQTLARLDAPPVPLVPSYLVRHLVPHPVSVQASVAAPMTSKAQTIGSMIICVAEGRCTLMATYQIFQVWQVSTDSNRLCMEDARKKAFQASYRAPRLPGVHRAAIAAPTRSPIPVSYPRPIPPANARWTPGLRSTQPRSMVNAVHRGVRASAGVRDQRGIHLRGTNTNGRGVRRYTHRTERAVHLLVSGPSNVYGCAIPTLSQLNVGNYQFLVQDLFFTTVSAVRTRFVAADRVSRRAPNLLPCWTSSAAHNAWASCGALLSSPPFERDARFPPSVSAIMNGPV